MGYSLIKPKMDDKSRELHIIYINHMRLVCRVQRAITTPLSTPDVNIKHRELCSSDYIGRVLISKMSCHIQYNIIQLMTFHKVDTVIYQPRGSDVHRSQRLR